MSTQEQNTPPLTITMGLAMHITEYPEGLKFLEDLKQYYIRMEAIEKRVAKLEKFEEWFNEKERWR